MRFVIRDPADNTYLDKDGDWVTDVQQALLFTGKLDGHSSVKITPDIPAEGDYGGGWVDWDRSPWNRVQLVSVGLKLTGTEDAT